MNTVGNKIRDLRVRRGINQENIAQHLGISQPSYARLEQDDNRITITRLIEIAKILNTSAAYLLDDTIKISKRNLKENNPYLDIVDEFNKQQITDLKDEIKFLRSIITTLSTGNKSFWVS